MSSRHYLGLGTAGVLALFLSACASTHGLSSGSASGSANGPKVATQSQYKSGNMKPYTVRGKTYVPSIPEPGYSQTGEASWYGSESGSRTATGDPFDPDGVSAAHRTFPLPSIAEVTNLDNGKSIRVRVNDRGPFNDRVIDLSKGAAKALGVYQTGTARVRVTWLGPAESAGAAVTPAIVSSSETGNYIVQLGAFSLRDNALAAQARMDEVRVEKRGTLYIVYLGPFDTAAKAETQRQKAIDAGFDGAILKRDD